MLKNQETKQDKILFILMFIFVIFMFAFKEILILFFSDYKNLYALKNVDINTFEETFLYLPMVRDFTFDKLAFMFVKFPPITFFVYSLLYKITSSFNVLLFVSHVIFPSLSFYFIYLIFKKYLYKSWAAPHNIK
ncbi:MAG: hypothetical protein GY817_01295 [bacterium]|nr:hypothetical protein [bacterium]